MSSCRSCKYAQNYLCGMPVDFDTEWYCTYDGDNRDKPIPHPYFMGGKRRCLCYKKREKEYDVFVYPTPHKVPTDETV